MPSPSFDLSQPYGGPDADLILGPLDFMSCHELDGISHRGKDFIAFLQEIIDNVVPLGDWRCRISRRDLDEDAFEAGYLEGLEEG